MKNFLTLLFLFFAPLLSIGQVITIPDPATLATKSWVLEQIKAAGVAAPPVVDPVLQPCKRGPQLISVSGITSNRLSTLFDGDEVFSIQWKIIQNGETLRSGKFEPKSNRPELEFAILQPGTYQLYFSGVTCEGSSHLEFKIEKPTSEVLPIPDEGWNTKIITSGLSEHMDIKLTGVAGNRVISDNSNYPLPDGHDFLYMINADIVRQKTPLTNYSYQSNAPIRIWKAMIRTEIDNLNRWSDEQHNYYRSDAAATFSHNTSIAYLTASFSDGRKDSETGFLNFVPQSYDPEKQFFQWGSVGKDISLPKGHVFVLRKGIWPLNQIAKKGITHFSNYDLPWQTDLSEVTRLRNAGLTYNDVPKEVTIFNLQPNGEDRWENGYNLKYWKNGPLSDQESINAANQTDIGHALWIGETEEGAGYMPSSMRMWKVFYKRLNERYKEHFGKRDIPYYIAHNYYTPLPLTYDLDMISIKDAKRLLTMAPSEMPYSEYSPGGNLSSTNLIMEGIYLGPPDIQNSGVFKTVFKLETIKHLGYSGGIFLTGAHEWRPNNLEKYSYQDGVYYNYSKMPLDPSVVVNYGFLAQVFGKVLVEWGTSGIQEGIKMWDKNWMSGLWIPESTGKLEYFNNQHASSFPYLAESNTFGGFNGSQDFCQFSQQLFTDSYALVEGGQDEYLKFRIDGGKWIEPENFKANDIINAYHEKRGIVHSRRLNEKTVWFYLNPFADNTQRDLEIILPNGQVVVKKVSGNIVHVTSV
jgi:hypothetical protein